MKHARKMFARLVVLGTLCGCSGGGGAPEGATASASVPGGAAPATTAPADSADSDLEPAKANRFLLTTYISDPAQIAFALDKTAQNVAVSAPAGAVVAKGAPTAGAHAWIYAVARDGLKADATVLAGKLLASAPVGADGSFTANVPCDADCLIIVTTEEHADGQIPVPASYGAGEITAALRALTFDEPTVELTTALFSAVITRFLEYFTGPRKDKCQVTFPRPCAPVEGKDAKLNFYLDPGDGTLEERCHAVVDTYVDLCRVPPGASVPATFTNVHTQAKETATFTAKPGPGCFVSLPADCKGHANVPRDFYDVFAPAPSGSAVCRDRLPSIAVYCQIPRGQRISALYRASADAAPESFNFDVDFDAPDPARGVAGDRAFCESSADFWAQGLNRCLRAVDVRLCVAGPDRARDHGRLGLVVGESLECVMRGFYGSSGVLHFLAAGEPGTVPVRIFTGHADDRFYETLAPEGSSHDPSWQAGAAVAGLFPDNSADPRLVPVHVCPQLGVAFAESVVQSGCVDWIGAGPAEAGKGPVIGYALP